MEMDVDLHKAGAVELMTISAGSYNITNNINNNHHHHHQHNNNNNNSNSSGNNSNIANNNVAGNGTRHARQSPPAPLSLSLSLLPSAPTAAAAATGRSSPMRPAPSTPAPRVGCCGILSRLLCAGGANTAKTASSSRDYNNISSILPTSPPTQHQLTAAAASTVCGTRRAQHRRTPQEIYFESRGKSCKKLLKFNGSCNKILLYPEEGWARTASSSYWTITPCWWQPNRCRIEEFAGTQRHATKAKMVPLEQKGSLLIAGHFRSKKCGASANNTNSSGSSSTGCKGSGDRDADEFKLYLSSNISMEDYNMGYCLTGFVERRCQQTNTFQMTHFAVIKRQWPSISSSDAKST